jgi:hypothetical protein
MNMAPLRAITLCLVGLIALLAACAEVNRQTADENIWKKGKIRLYAKGPNIDDYTPQEMGEMGVTLAGSGALYGLKTIPELSEADRQREKIEQYHKAGLEWIVSTSTTRVHWKELQVQYPDLREHVVLGPDGQPQLFKGRPYAYIANLLDPYWLDLHLKGIEYVLECGADALYLDNPFVVFSHDPETQAKWEAYLKEKLGSLDGLKDAAQFDNMTKAMMDWELRTDTPIQLANAENSKDQLVQANLTMFRYYHFMEFFKELYTRTKQKGELKLGFNGHLNDRSYYYWTEGKEYYDFIEIEHSMAGHWGFQPEWEGLLGFMIAYACSDDKPVYVKDKLLYPVENYWHEEAERYYNFDWQLPARDRHELYIAEGVAMEGAVMPVTPVWHVTQTFKKRYEHYPETVKKYYAFNRDYENYLTDTSSPARVCLLFSYRSHIYSSINESLFGIGDALFKNHIPFDVKIVENESSLVFDQYSTLIATELSTIDDAVAQKIMDAVSNGATLLVSGELGTRNPVNYLPRSEPTILQDQETIAHGKGNIVRLPFNGEDLFQHFNKPIQNAHVGNLLQNLQSENGRWKVQSESQGENLIVVVPRKKGDGSVMHCLNYNFHLLDTQLSIATEEDRLAQEQVIPQLNVRISVDNTALPNVRSAALHVPGQSPQDLKISRKDGRMEITVPRLDVYAMIVFE